MPKWYLHLYYWCQSFYEFIYSPLLVFLISLSSSIASVSHLNFFSWYLLFLLNSFLCYRYLILFQTALIHLYLDFLLYWCTHYFLCFWICRYFALIENFLLCFSQTDICFDFYLTLSNLLKRLNLFKTFLIIFLDSTDPPSSLIFLLNFLVSILLADPYLISTKRLPISWQSPFWKNGNPSFHFYYSISYYFDFVTR